MPADAKTQSPTGSPITYDGEIVNFRCNGAVIWPVYLASIVKPDLALTLKHE